MSKKPTTPDTPPRRDFLKRTGALGGAALLPNIITGCTTTGPSPIARPPANERITMGVIGIGWQGEHNMGKFLESGGVQVLAVCDVDRNHLGNAKRIVDRTQGNEDCATYVHFEELIARDDIDAVLLSLPDHWHAIPAIAAANAGKHIWGEKPLTHKLAEGRAMVDAVDRNGVTWQTGSWQRSVANFHQCAELVRNGVLGKVHTIECGLTSGHTDYGKTADQKAFTTPPQELDYERWLGPSGTPSELPYAPARVHKNWRWVMAHGGGALMDWVGHHVDIAHWGMGLDRTGPTAVRGTGTFPPADDLWDSPTEYDCYAKYEGGLTIHMNSSFPGGTKWIGDNGWIFVGRGKTDASDPALLKADRDDFKIQLYRSRNHWKNFTDCIRSGEETITPCEIAHRSASVGHLCNIAMYTGREIEWDPKTERILGDDEASAMLEPNYQQGWNL